MFGAFRPTLIKHFHASSSLGFAPTGVASGGLLHKRPATLNSSRKANLRRRMHMVDDVIAAVAASGLRCKAIDEAVALPTTDEMAPRDKYTTFSRKHKGYRKGVHLVPKWTRLSFRTNPKGF
ncbi:mitochondrial ribosomal protein L31 [Papiliotrema laurentii]|uniref:Mitochondrial ribosomal protein L31 n=1 Tax=Papiliotrema laurentii TaxID=5418 RepID=A0AAD9CUD2_PAPLA|nr:mitochondrial ribosomal protein L31 [Papiliotrema laurentii]